jgi:hypothetical protein
VSVSGRASRSPDSRPESANLADILERVLDKGIVIVGDIRVNLLDIELLTIKIRLLVASVDKARELGIDWWEDDRSLSSGRGDSRAEIERLQARVAELEAAAGAGPERVGRENSGRRSVPRKSTRKVTTGRGDPGKDDAGKDYTEHRDD